MFLDQREGSIEAGRGEKEDTRISVITSAWQRTRYCFKNEMSLELEP